MKTHLRPIAFITASTDHGTLILNRNDFRLTPAGGYGVGYQILTNTSFDREEVEFVKELLLQRRNFFGDGVVAIDCGANIGVHTVEWSRLMYDWGTVLAIEAQERIFYALAGNISINNCLNARAIWAAVGSTSGSIGVPTPNYLVPSSFGSLELRQTARTEYIGQDINYSDVQQTNLISIDELNLERIDLIKLDVEGMELEVLQGARKSIEKFCPQIVAEKIKLDEIKLKATLHSFGYKLYPLGINILAIHGSDPTTNLISSESI